MKADAPRKTPLKQPQPSHVKKIINHRKKEQDVREAARQAEIDAKKVDLQLLWITIREDITTYHKMNKNKRKYSHSEIQDINNRIDSLAKEYAITSIV